MSALRHYQPGDPPTSQPAVNGGARTLKYRAAPHYLYAPHKWTAKLVDTSKSSPSHNHCRLAKVNMAFVPHQEWLPKDSILFELTDDKHLLDSLITDSASQFNYAIKENE